MVGEITDSLLQGAWWRHTDGKFYPCQAHQGPVSLGEALRAQEFLRIVKAEIDPHLEARESRTANYEDLYAAVLQIVQDETFEIINPMINRSIAAIKAASEHLYEGQEHHIDKNAFASLADRACDLVQWAVYHNLAKAKAPVSLELIADVAANVEVTDIFTLNHDPLIERQLAARGIPFSDGFGDKKGDARIYGAKWDGKPVRVLKLHGSTNWYLFRFPEWDQFASVDTNQGYAKDENGKLLDDLSQKPMFLTGTTVKEQAYGVGLVGEIFSKFREVLSNHHTLICCGYGWGDKGINIRLGQWLRDAKENRIIILHGGSKDEILGKRFWYWRWQEYAAAGKVVLVPRWFAGCTLADLEPYFDM